MRGLFDFWIGASVERGGRKDAEHCHMLFHLDHAANGVDAADAALKAIFPAHIAWSTNPGRYKKGQFFSLEIGAAGLRGETEK